MALHPDGSILVVDESNNRILRFSADWNRVLDTAGSREGKAGCQDGRAAQARFNHPKAVVVLSDGRILVADKSNRRICMLSADLQKVTTVAGDVTEGHRDGAASQATFTIPCGLAVLPDGRVLVSEWHCIRVISADLQQVATVAGTGEAGHQDGAGVQARFDVPTDMLVLPDNRVLVADSGNHCIRVLSADLQEVTTVAGDGERGHRDGAAAQARFWYPIGLARLFDGSILVADENTNSIRMLSADLQQVTTVVGGRGWGHTDGAAADATLAVPERLLALSDGSVLVSTSDRIRVLHGFPQDPVFSRVQPRSSFTGVALRLRM